MIPQGYDDDLRGKPVLPPAYYAHRHCWIGVLYVVRTRQIFDTQREVLAALCAPLIAALERFQKVRNRDWRLFYAQWRRKAVAP